MQTSIRFRLTAWYVAALALTLVLLDSATFLFIGGEQHVAAPSMENGR